MADLPVELGGTLNERLARCLDVEGKIPRALDALGPIGGRDVLLIGKVGGIRAGQLAALGARLVVVPENERPTGADRPGAEGADERVGAEGADERARAEGALERAGAEGAYERARAEGAYERAGAEGAPVRPGNDTAAAGGHAEHDSNRRADHLLDDQADDSVDVVVGLWTRFRDSAAEIAAAERVARPGGRLLVVHDYGRDDVSRLRGDLPEYGAWSHRKGPFLANGFRLRVIHCFWTFESIDDATDFLGTAFGDAGLEVASTMTRPRVSYKVAIYHRTLGEPLAAGPSGRSREEAKA